MYTMLYTMFQGHRSIGSGEEAFFKDWLPHLFHGFRDKYFNKISFDNMLYFHN